MLLTEVKIVEQIMARVAHVRLHVGTPQPDGFETEDMAQPDCIMSMGYQSYCVRWINPLYSTAGYLRDIERWTWNMLCYWKY